MAQQPRGFHLTQVYPKPDTDIVTDVDIIAIHGLDTKSPDTWIWRSKDRNKAGVNWLADLHMLPSKVGQARIFTCDWPADMFVPSDLMQKAGEEFSRRLLDAIERRDSEKKNRPILFIASCLGGVILMKALTMAQSEYAFIRRATRAIVFLATPFRGTSFEDVANWAEPGLKTWASIKGHQVTTLLKIVKESFNLNELVRNFIQLCQDPDHSYEVMTFYELGKTNLYHKLVDESSATLQIVPNPLPLDRRHQLMNKFCGPDDDHYKCVAGKIEQFLGNIRRGGPDAWVRTRHYTLDRLKIERLSGEQLPIKQCYINLAIVEQLENRADHSNISQSSPFSLFARQKAETPDKTIQVELGTIFNERKGRDSHPIQPRRVLIRGRAGIGKTTLCKKIVFDFTYDIQSKVHSAWTGLFDRLLWIPLRNLKGRLAHDAHKYNHEELFYHEYFFAEGDREGHRLAEDLWQTVKADSRKTLFLLDGLDEVSQDLSGDASRFLHLLLNQPNVIITSRPNVSLPAGLNALDLELETVGFYPDQVKDYIEADPEIKPRADEVQLFLHEHWLIQGLVRIPIQLDALCYTWEDFDPGTVPNTMTGMYKAIEQKLWKKDAVRLEKVSEGDASRSARPGEIKRKVGAEIALLEWLAFNGLYSDVVDFSPQHRDKIVEIFPPFDLPLDDTLARLSFLRTSDSTSKIEDRNYHFIHLTFQEYFAAKYFVRQWLTREPLEYTFLGNQENVDASPITDPVVFLQKYKYTARYDILWRFVAGLLDAEKKAAIFIDEIEKEPLDLLGPTHQRLVMHCLSEISTFLPNRTSLEHQLSEWLLFECKITQSASLASEVEFPEKALDEALRDGSEKIKATILKSLTKRKILPLSVVDQASPLLEHQDRDIRGAAVDALGRQSTLPDKVLEAVAARLDDQDGHIRRAAEAMLRQHEKFYCALFNRPSAVSLYKILLRKSFGEQISWYIDNGHICIHMANIRMLSIKREQNGVGP